MLGSRLVLHSNGSQLLRLDHFGEAMLFFVDFYGTRFRIILKITFHLFFFFLPIKFPI